MHNLFVSEVGGINQGRQIVRVNQILKITYTYVDQIHDQVQ